MTKSPRNSASNDKLRTGKNSSENSSELTRYSTNQFDLVFERMVDAVGGKRAADLASALNISQASVSGAKRRRNIPDSWYLIISDKYDVSTDWLRTGEGKMKREGKKYGWTSSGMKRIDRVEEDSIPVITGTETCIPDDVRKAAVASHGEEPALYDVQEKQGLNIADLVSKTIEVLQSGTVFQTALESNIEAFHHAIVLDKKIDQVEERIMSKVSVRLDALEVENKQIHAENKQLQDENQQLRHDLEESRSQSVVRDTG